MFAVEPRVYLRPKPLRLPRRKGVTIGIGFVCPDGLVLCSDRQLTVAGSHKFSETKIFNMQEAISGTRLLFSYAGDESAAKSFYQHFKSELLTELKAPADPKVPPWDRRRLFFERVYRDRRAKTIQTLSAIDSQMFGVHLFRSYGHDVVEGRSEYIGTGDSSVLRYATDLLLRPLSSVSEAQVIGSYLVRLANRYVDGCSGGPDISTLHSNGIITEGTGGCFPDEQARFGYCEQEIGKIMRELLLSGGTREAFTRSASQTLESKP